MLKSSQAKWWLATLLLVLISLGGLFRLKFDTQLSSLFPQNIKESRGLGMFLKHFAHEGELVIMLDQGQKEDLFVASEAVEKKLLTRPDIIAKVIARPPWEDKPQDMVDFFAFSLLNLPAAKLAKLNDSLSEPKLSGTLQTSLESLADSLTMEENAAGYDPLGLAKLVMEERGKGLGGFDGFASKDGSIRLMIAEATNPKVHYHEKYRWLQEVRGVINAAIAESKAPKVRARLTGEPAFMAEISVGMENDMKGSGISTLVLSALLFFLIYRSLKPLLYINLALVLIILATLGLSGWLLGSLTVFTAGFASILVGLTIDYGVLIYEESKNSGLGGRELRQYCGRSILAAAGTTAVAFLAMRASSLPGLRELGVLLGMGVAVGSVIMLLWFAQWLGPKPQPMGGWLEWEGHPKFLRIMPPVVVGFLVISIAGLAVKGIPQLNATPDTLRPRECEAQDTMTDMLQAMSGDRTGKSLLIKGKDHEEVAAKLADLAKLVADADAKGAVHRAALPGPVWPSGKQQAENLATNGQASLLINSKERLRKAVNEAGFNEVAFGLADGVFASWEKWQKSAAYPVWPATFSSQWTLSRFHKVADDGVYAMAMLQTKPNEAADELVTKLRDLDGVFVLSDGIVLKALKERLPIETLRITAALAVGMLLMLVWTFKAWWPIFLCLAALLVNLLSLLGVMAWTGLEWNLINLAGLLLCLGTGVDYSIHVLLSLQRNAGDVPQMQRTTGRALLLCALSSVIGFGSLSWAGNRGLASLGIVCSIALFLSLIIALFVLPYCWRKQTK
jgi:uncharacterized protein